MAQERPTAEPRELKFGGVEKADGIRHGFAITTLRNPRDSYNFSQGEVILADCFESGEKVPVVVITNETKKLKDFSVPQLALDGFFSPEHAAEEMKEWPGYEKTTLNSKMQAITFVSEESYKKLPEDLQIEIINNDFDYLIANRNLRTIFYPTMAYHLSGLGQDLTTWLDFLKENYLVSRHDERVMKNFLFDGTNMYKIYTGRVGSFHELSIHPERIGFKTLILGGIEEIEG